MNTGYFKKLVLDNVFHTNNQGKPKIPDNYYIGLLYKNPADDHTYQDTGKPGDANGADSQFTKYFEPTADDYARRPLSNILEGAKYVAATQPYNAKVTNSATIRFPAGDDTETKTDWFPANHPATHYGIFDSESDGFLLMYNELTKHRVIEGDTVALIEPQSLNLQLLDS